jgi:tetratricopeptide (TPR) repeat protein
MYIRAMYVFITISLFFRSVFGQEVSAPVIETLQNNIYSAYVQGNIPMWEKALSDMESLYSERPANIVLYDILLAQYGLIGYYIGSGQNSKGSFHLEKAEENLKRLATVRAYRTTSLVFESAFLAYRISLRPIRAVQLGPRSYRLIDEAMELDPAYSRVWIEKGNAAFYTPSVFGGDKSGSIKHYLKAIELLENNMSNNHRWLYLSTLMALANAYEATGELFNAILTAEKALAFESDFLWAKDEVLPKYRSMIRQ